MRAILTGHSRGLGAALAAELLSRGIDVLGISRVKNAALPQRFPAALTQVELDLSDPALTATWTAGDTLQRFLSGSDTTLLINNAGMVQPVGPLASQDTLSISRAVSLNVAAPMMLAAAFTAAAAQSGDKRILHVSSGAGRNPYPGWSVYCATKAALDHHARAVASDQTSGVRICSLAPGVVDTDMQAEIRASALDRFPLRERFEALKRDGGLASPEACAQNLIDYLLSERFGESPVTDLRELA
jgi:benzil reductase ((S)-benzoin forming)